MKGKLLEINLFGACAVHSTVKGSFSISGNKHKALFALLGTAPFGRRTRSFLQETLWGQACYDTGRQSLRRALSDIKAVMGEAYSQLLSVTNSEITLDLSKVTFTGGTTLGPFLEGLEINERAYLQWLEGIRSNPGQLAGLFSLISSTSDHSALPVVAIIPFRAITSDPVDAIFGDWLAEEVCRSLSRSRLMAVISHLSCREMAKTCIDIKSVREQLRADFCVSGSLRNIGGKIIIDADFVDARSGRILWTRQFEGSKDTFLSDASLGVGLIVSAVGSAIADEAITQIRSRPLAEIEDHRLLIAGVSLMHHSTLRDFAKARELLQEALRRSPHSPEVHAWLGKWFVLSVFNGWSVDTRLETRLAKDCTARALDLSPNNSFVLTIDGFVESNLNRRLDLAERQYDMALRQNPNESLAWLLKGAVHTFRSDGKPAVSAVERARSLSPIDPFGYFYDALVAGAYLANEQYDRALAMSERSLAINDRHLSTRRIKLFALHFLGRTEEACASAAELLARQPELTVEGYLRQHPSAEFRMGRMMAEALAAAGIPQRR